MKRIASILYITYTILYGNVTSRAAVKDTLLPKNIFIFESFGHSLGLLSISYEHNFYNVTKYLHFSWRSGIGWLPGYNKSDSSRAYAKGFIPIVLSCHLNYKNFAINFSSGYTASFGRKWEDLGNFIPQRFDGYESSFVVSMGFRYYIKNCFLGFYPCYVFNEPLGLRNRNLSWGLGMGVYL